MKVWKIYNQTGGQTDDKRISSMYFRCFVIIYPWIRAWPFIWTNLNPLYPRILCAKFGWNCPNMVLEKKMNRWKVHRKTFTDRQPDGRQAIRKCPLSFQLRWAKTTVGASLRSQHVVNNSISLMDECWVIFWANVSILQRVADCTNHYRTVVQHRHTTWETQFACQIFGGHVHVRLFHFDVYTRCIIHELN